MAIFIGPDGRVKDYDVDFNNDGSIKIKNSSAISDELEEQGTNFPQRSISCYDSYRPSYIRRKFKYKHTNNVKGNNSQSQSSSTPKRSNYSEERNNNKPSISKSQTNTKNGLLNKFMPEVNRMVNSLYLSPEAKGFVKHTIQRSQKHEMTEKGLFIIIKSLKLFKEVDLINTSFGRYNYIVNKYLRLTGITDKEQILRYQIPEINVKRNELKNISKKNKNKPSSKRQENINATPRDNNISKSHEDYSSSTQWDSEIYMRQGPKPKYGYVRDRFGRVMERDSYRENMNVNPYSASSSYDFEDDNDSQDITD